MKVHFLDGFVHVQHRAEYTGLVGLGPFYQGAGPETDPLPDVLMLPDEALAFAQALIAVAREAQAALDSSYESDILKAHDHIEKMDRQRAYAWARFYESQAEARAIREGQSSGR